MSGYRKTGVTAIFLIVLLTIVIIVLPVEAAPYTNYNYNYWNERVAGPQAYLPARIITGEDLGIGSFQNPQDLFVSPSGKIYILDTGNNRIVVMDQNFKLYRTIDEFEKDGKKERFNRPEGIFVTESEHIFIADTQNSRIVELDQNGGLIREIGRPENDQGEFLSETIRFQPKKLVVGKFGELYVLANNVYDGILKFDNDGNFDGFIAAVRVSPSLVDIFWRKIATQEQLSRMSLVLPTEFTNITLDEIGLIYTVNKNKIRRLNQVGKDLLDESPTGDIGYAIFEQDSSAVANFQSNFVDIVVRENEIYSVLDDQLGRVFTYDNRGRLLYVFGGSGDQRGRFRVPVAIDALEDKILVLDREAKRVTVFEPTRYAELIHQAIDFYHQGEYDAEIEIWQEVLRLNNNFDLAHSSIGRALLMQGDVENSLEYFRLANDREGYSRAYAVHRREKVNDNFAKVSTALVVLVFLGIFLNRAGVPGKIKEWFRAKETDLSSSSQAYRRLKQDVIKPLGFSLRVIFHPFAGFWELKYERRGNLIGAVVISVLTVFAYVFQKQYTGFIFNTENLRRLNIWLEAATIIVPLALWCIVSYSITTLFDGKGTIKEIFITTAYALTPLPLMLIPTTLISNFMIMSEGSFVTLIVTISLIWALALLFFGSLTIHEYSFGKNIIISFSTLVGMGIVIFGVLLFISIFEMIVDLAYNLTSEIRFRF
ncbi:MAG TPA: DUF1282 family protein [Firmicutes bacterium]|nr:DUF1282 family protein [Bacillota bacterium]